MTHRSRIWLCLPPGVLCLLDGALTLWGQPAAYWQHDYSHANELNPVGDLLLRLHPAAFAAGLTAWATVFLGAILLLPKRWAVRSSMIVTFAHAVGASSWLVYRLRFGWPAAVLLLLIAGCFGRWCWRIAPSAAAGGESIDLRPRPQ